MRTWISLAALLAACGGGQQSQPTQPGPQTVAATPPTAPPASADPWTKTPAPPKAPTAEERQAKIEAALARVATIQPKLVEMRGIKLDAPVPAAHQTTDDFRAFVQRELAKELPADKAAKVASALHHIGLYTKPIDLLKVLEQTMTSQAAAYYDPATKKFFVVMAPDDDTTFDTISAHELTHGLQDEAFDLVKFLPPTLDEDASIARRFVVEGDATFSMIAYLATSKGGNVASIIPMIKPTIAGMANVGVKDYGNLMQQQTAGFSGMDDQMKASMQAMKDLPAVIIGPMIDSYMKGAVLAMTAFENGGWDAVNALFKNPPDSTEQVLHPSTKLYPKREKPTKVTLPKLAGTELTSNVVGELQWSIYLQQWNVDQPEAAPGWGGDRYAVMQQADGSLVGYLATTWDTAEDAKQFADAYVASLKARFPSADVSKPADGIARGDKAKVFVRTKGNHVFIVDGAPDAKAIDALARGAKFK